MTERDRAADVIRSVLDDAGLAWESPVPYTFSVTLPGTRKLTTTCGLHVGEHSVQVHAFVMRAPDDDPAAVHRYLLERNLKTYGVAFGVDHDGDVHLAGRLALHAVTPAEVDRLLGCVLEYADGAFNTLLELGFGPSIAREWAWRRARGESTANLAAFAHLAPDEST